MSVDKLLRDNGILPESPIGRVVTELSTRVERLEQVIVYDGTAPAEEYVMGPGGR